MEYQKINGQIFKAMMINASNKLEEQKEFVNSLNVFPVPDGDTGTNMSMTFKSAVTSIISNESESIQEVAKQLSKGALMGARGNSGVILSQILRGIANGFEGYNEIDSTVFAISLSEGSKSAYKAVMRPTEGTILTIIRAAGESAIKSEDEDIEIMLKKVCSYSEAILNKTPEMLAVLKKAKVVDAGGMGLLILLKGMHEALSGNVHATLIDYNQVSDKATSAINTETEIKFGYCTEFFIKTKKPDAEKLKLELEPLGDSIIVVGVEDIIKVHIHTNEPGSVLTHALMQGELSKVKIDNMREQHRNLIDMDKNDEKASEEVDELEEDEIKKYAFISVAMGDGITNIFKDLGVDYVIEGGQTMNPSTQDILDCITKVNAETIFILPNNKNIIMAANQACELTDKKLIVVPTKTIPQGISAITAFNLDSSADENLSLMNNAIKNVKSASITYAVRDTEIEGKVIAQGDILGLVEGKINVVGKDIYKTCSDVISNMITDDSELITVFYGNEVETSKVTKIETELANNYSEIDVQFYKGNQPLYYFIISVE